MRKVILPFLLFIPFSHFAFSEEYMGRLFDLGKTGEKALYTQKVQVVNSPDGTTTTTGAMFDASGTTVMSERAVYSGSTFISQEIQNQLEHKEYRATLKDKKAYFETYSVADNGEKKLISSHHETISSQMISGPLAENFIRDNWEKLMNGKRVDFRFAVFERQETIGFSFKKKTETDVDGKSAVVLLMRPTSFFVSLVVNPMEISVDKESKTIIHYKGRTPLKTGKEKSLEAEIVYDRQTPSISRATASEKKTD